MFKKENIQNQLKDLLKSVPENTIKIFVLDELGEVDREVKFKEPAQCFDYLWEQLPNVPLVYVVKTEKIQRACARFKGLQLVLDIQDGQIVLSDFDNKTSVSKSGEYKFLN